VQGVWGERLDGAHGEQVRAEILELGGQRAAVCVVDDDWQRVHAEIRSWIEHRLATVDVVEGLCRITTHPYFKSPKVGAIRVIPKIVNRCWSTCCHSQEKPGEASPKLPPEPAGGEAAGGGPKQKRCAALPKIILLRLSG
jgi:hypothetical protein